MTLPTQTAIDERDALVTTDSFTAEDDRDPRMTASLCGMSECAEHRA